MKRTLLSRLRGDDGLGMVLVLAMGGVLTTLMILTTTMALRSLESSRQHVSFESALAAADGGVDAVLARTRDTYVSTGFDTYATPAVGDPTCNQTALPWPFLSQPTVEQERTWARAQLTVIAAIDACRVKTPNGEVALLKPSGRQVMYAMAFSPAYDAIEVKQRLLKAEYLFTPYAPSHAILTGGDIMVDASTKVTTAPPNDVTLAAVHTNGQLSVLNGNPTVTGLVTQSGGSPSASSNNFDANPGDAVTGAPIESIPFDGARAVWNSNHDAVVPGGWWDLCDDGVVRRPDGATPCTGTPELDVSAGGDYRGWEFDDSTVPPTWRATSKIKVNGYSGTYYVDEADVLDVASNAGPRVPNLTVIASAVGSPASCDKVGGNIDWGSIDPAAPSLQDTWLIADQDLRTSSNYQAGSASGSTIVSGFFIAGDQMEMSTSSNGAYGAVIAADQCDPADGLSMVDWNSIKNPAIYYDPNAKAPFTSVINNTLWLEYGG